VIGAWPADPDAAAVGNCEALGDLAPVRAVLPSGSGSLTAGEFEEMSAAAFDPQWIAGLV
jgi:dethiobiotin synthetase